MFGGKKSEDRPEVEERSDPRPVSRGDGEAKTSIGAGTVIKGEVSIEGDAIVHGTVEGSLAATGQVEVMKTGTVKADIRGKSVRVIGRVEGKILSHDRVQLITGAYVRGDIHSQSLKIDEGVFFQGACVMGESASEVQKSKVIPIPSGSSDKAAKAA